MLGRLAELLLFGISPLVVCGLLMPAALADEEQRRILGEVHYRERIALPYDAVLTVELANPHGVVAGQTIFPAGQVPIPFEIRVDEAMLRADADGSIRATIAVNGMPMFVADPPHAFEPRLGERLRILLRRAGQRRPPILAVA